MLLIEKQIKNNLFAQIVRVDIMSLDNCVVVSYRYELRLKQQKSVEDRYGLQSNRVGSFSSYGFVDSFAEAKDVFKKKWGGWGESALRGDALKAWKSKQSRPQPKLEVVVSQIKEEVIISVPKPEKVKKEKPEGIIKTSIKSIEGLNRQQAVEFLTAERLHKSLVSRIVNQVYGKVDPVKPEPKQKGASKTKNTQSPNKTPQPILLTLIERVQWLYDEYWGGKYCGVAFDAEIELLKPKKRLTSKSDVAMARVA